MNYPISLAGRNASLWKPIAVLGLLPLALTGAAKGEPPSNIVAKPEIQDSETRKKESLYTELEHLLRIEVGELAAELPKVRKRQDQLIYSLRRCIAIHPTNRQEEIIAENAALMLGQYGGQAVSFSLAKNIDLRTDRYVTMRALSSEGMVGFVESRYPCVRSLLLQGEPSVKAILRSSLPPDHKRSDLQLELAAYTLLEICCPVEKREGVLVPQVVRDELEMLADERFVEIGRRGSSLESSLHTLKRFLQEVEPHYYRYPSTGKKHNLGPAKNSIIFPSTRETETD